MSSTVLAQQLPHRAVVRVGGAGRAAFLQGLISNDIGLCSPDRLVYAALLTPQGKFLHEFFIHDGGESFLLETEAARCGDLISRLSTYKLRAKITIEQNPHEIWVFPHGGMGLADPRLAALGTRLLFLPGQGPQNVQMAEPDFYDRHRLTLGVAESRDMIEGKTALLDANFDFLNGISWTKGCYVGQELTARMHHRALVKKRMLPVRMTGDAPDAGMAVTYKGMDIGEMRSSNADLGLALLNLETAKKAIAENHTFECGHARLAVHWPDWLFT